MSGRRSCCRRCLVLLAAMLATCGSERGPDGPLRTVARAEDSQASDGPRVFFTDVETGPVAGGPNNLGVPIAIFGKGFGTSRGTSRVTIGGTEVASYLVWGANNAHNKRLDMIVVQPGAKVSSGAIVVTVNGRSSNSDYSFTVNSGRVYYVALFGSDGNACSVSAPCATILRVVSVMKPGDTALVKGGSYTEGEIWIRSPNGGAAGAPKVIKSYPGEEVFLTNQSRDLLIDVDYVTISGLQFQNGKSAFVVGWANRDERGNKFINNTFSGTINYAAIEITGSDHVLAGNVCEVASSTQGTQGHCYYIMQGSNLKILYNVGSGAPGYGLHMYDERRAATDFQRMIRDVVVEGNVLKNSSRRSGMIVAMADEGGYGNRIENVTIRNNIFVANNHAGLMVAGHIQGLKIYNNTFYQNGREGIYIENGADVNGVDIRNNLIYQSANGNCVNDCSVLRQGHLEIGAAARNVTLDTNSYQPGSPVIVGRKDANPITGPVQFANATDLDFHLQPGSAVVDRGVSLAAVPTDFDGRRRPQGAAYDVGAFEYLKPGIASLTCDPFVVLTPGSTSCTVGLTVQASAGDSLQLGALAGGSSLRLPSNVSAPAGASSVEVRVDAEAVADRTAVTIWAGLNDTRQTFELWVLPAGSPAVLAVVNAASFLPGPVAPGGMVTALGLGLGPATAASAKFTGNRFATAVAGATAFFDDTPAPLLLVQSNQLNAVVPFDVSGKDKVRLQIDFEGRRSNPVSLEVAQTSPGIITTTYAGQGQAVAVNEDGSLNSSTNPARRSSVVTFYAVGLGQTEPPGVDGVPTVGALTRTTAPVSVRVGGQAADLLYAGGAPGFIAGLYQINARLPSSVVSGAAVPLVLNAGAADSQTGVTLGVQ